MTTELPPDRNSDRSDPNRSDPHSDDERLLAAEVAEMRASAMALVDLLRTREEELADAAAVQLFPDGVPGPITIPLIMRAVVGTITRAAQAMAEADAAYNRALRKHKPEEAPESLISQDVAEKLAVTAELEEIVRENADVTGAKLEQRFFPSGLPDDLSVLGFLQALRERIEAAADGVAPEAGPLSDEAIDSLEEALGPIVQFCISLAAIADMSEFQRELEDLASPPEVDYDAN